MVYGGRKQRKIGKLATGKIDYLVIKAAILYVYQGCKQILQG